MNIWELSTDQVNYINFDVPELTGMRIREYLYDNEYSFFDSISIKSIEEDCPDLVPANFMAVKGGVFVCDSQTHTAINSEFSEYFHFINDIKYLSSKIEDNLSIMIPVKHIDCINYEKSIHRVFHNRVLKSWEKIALDLDKISGNHVFHINGVNTLYCDDYFVDFIKRNNFTGLIFRSFLYFDK